MKITNVSSFSIERMDETLMPGEYWIWTVHLDDGTTEKIRANDGTTTKAVEEHFANQGKKVVKIDYNFGIQKGDGGLDSKERSDYHSQQDDLVRRTAKQGYQFEEEAEVFNEWKQLNELSVHTLSSYRDATARPRSTDRLGKVVKHTRGHHQAINKIAKATGDMTPNKDHARTVHEEQLDELSNELLGKYKKAAGADASKADKEGNTAKGNKRFSGIIKATKKQFDNDKKGAVQEALLSILGEDFTSILDRQHQDDLAAKPKSKTVEIPYHSWTIRYRPATKAGELVAWQAMDKRGDVKHKSEAPTDKDAVADAEDWINSGGDAKQTATSNVTVDFNVDFAREFAPEGGDFYAAIDKDGNTPMLIISTEPHSGFKKSHVRTQKHKMTATTTPLPAITLSAKEANALGLQANGRYLLGAKDPIDNNTAMFPLIFQSIVQGKGDMMKMGKPGLTVAHNRD
jgi:hypothetical protein